MGDMDMHIHAADVGQMKDYIKIGHEMAQCMAKEVKKSDDLLDTNERQEYGSKLKKCVTELIHLNFDLHDSFEAFKHTSQEVRLVLNITHLTEFGFARRLKMASSTRMTLKKGPTLTRCLASKCSTRDWPSFLKHGRV